MIHRYCILELNGDYMLDFPNAGIINYATMKMETPLSAFTVAFWMKTLDEINQGTPFSYSVGAFDNALTVTNYDGYETSEFIYIALETLEFLYI